jgi:nicotinate-nucleotide adenylyltransferase
MSERKRIGLYGGTFDPVHLGHVDVARGVSELFEINTVLFVPAQVAPHKSSRVVTSPLHRHAMLVLATQNEPRFLISTYELDAPDRRYTVDTLAHFQRVVGDSSEIFFIMGADSWEEIRTWREWQRLLSMVNHIVVTRPGYDIEAAEVGATLQERISDVRERREPVGSTAGPRIFFTDVAMKDISATQIRRVAGEGRFDQLANLVPEPVTEYIKKYRLYRETNEPEFNS